MMENDVTPVPFSFFVSLCGELSNIKPRPATRGKNTPSSCDTEPTSVAVFRRWVQELCRRFPRAPPHTTSSLFLLLFPEEDARRKYGMKEANLAKGLANVFGFAKNDGVGSSLQNWMNPSIGASSLGEQVLKLLSNSSTCIPQDDGGQDRLNVQDVNAMLNELASKSAFSASCLRECSTGSKRTRQRILQTVYRRLQPFGAAVLTQIILKDLRPILYPVRNASAMESLVDFNSNAVHMLTLQEAMRIWDSSGVLLRCYKVQSTIEHSIRLFEEKMTSAITPQVGVPIQIPKCIKAQGCSDALKKFKSSATVWAETKYDGERMQIHVRVDGDGSSRITIFSKSGRDSTLDRIATHWIIRKTLGLPHDVPEEVRGCDQRRASPQKSVSTVILEAEMVAYNEDSGIDEFWRIRELIESSASGPRRKRTFGQLTGRVVSPSETLRHLALVFFDILYLNDTSLLSETYCSRRATLEAVIHPIPTYAFLAMRSEIPLSSGKSFSQSVKDLEQFFASSIARREEGLILKAPNARYADWQCPWVKLKKDYIPGYGDAVDLVLVGATWEKERGRSLRVPTSIYTTFFVSAFGAKKTSRPHLEVLFGVSYGLDRRHLEELNFLIRSLGTVQYTTDVQARLPFTFNPAMGLSSPSVILSQPLLVEVFGAGFTKAGENKRYELRFPRISKVHRVDDRSWLEGMTLAEFDDVAYHAARKSTTLPGKGIERAFGSPTRTLCAATVSQRTSRDEVPSFRPHTENCGHQKRPRIDKHDYHISNFGQIKHLHPMPFARELRKDMRRPFNSLTNYVVSPEAPPSLPCPCSLLGDTLPCMQVHETINATGGFPENLSCWTLVGASGPLRTAWSEMHPFADFLGKAIILLDCDLCPEDHDLAFIEQFVVPNVVHSREAFAVGCRWNCLAERSPRATISYGVVFVDEGSVRDWREAVPFTRQWYWVEGRPRPIFVFSSNFLRTDALDSSRMDDELDIKAKCLAAYL